MINISDEEFPSLIEQAGYEPISYNGRLGLITDDRIMVVAANLVEASDAQEQAAEILRGMREVENQRIYYWPNVKFG